MEPGVESLARRELVGRLRAFLVRRAPPGVDGDDLVQDVLLRMITRLPHLRDRERLDAWMYQIARRALVDAARATRRRQTLSQRLVHEPLAKDDAPRLRSELAACLPPLLATLDSQHREALELDLAAMPQALAARRAGVSVTALKSRLRRGRVQLRARLLACCRIELDGRGGPFTFQPKAQVCGSCRRPGTGEPS